MNWRTGWKKFPKWSRDKRREDTEEKRQRLQFKKKKKSNIYSTRVSAGKLKENGAGAISEATMAEIFPKLRKTSIHRIKIPCNLIQNKKFTPRYIIVKLRKTKKTEKILNA